MIRLREKLALLVSLKHTGVDFVVRASARAFVDGYLRTAAEP